MLRILVSGVDMFFTKNGSKRYHAAMQLKHIAWKDKLCSLSQRKKESVFWFRIMRKLHTRINYSRYEMKYDTQVQFTQASQYVALVTSKCVHCWHWRISVNSSIVGLHDIIWCQSDEHYLHFGCTKLSFQVRSTIQSLTWKMSNHQDFFHIEEKTWKIFHFPVNAHLFMVHFSWHKKNWCLLFPGIWTLMSLKFYPGTALPICSSPSMEKTGDNY